MIDDEMQRKFKKWKNKLILDVTNGMAKCYYCMQKNLIAEQSNEIKMMQLEHQSEIESIKKEVREGKKDQETAMYAAIDNAVLQLHNRISTHAGSSAEFASSRVNEQGVRVSGPYPYG